MDVLMVIMVLAGSAMVMLVVLARRTRSRTAKASSNSGSVGLKILLAKEVAVRVAAGNHGDALLHLEICNVGLFTAREMVTIAVRIHRKAVAAQSADVDAIAARIRSLRQYAARP